MIGHDRKLFIELISKKTRMTLQTVHLSSSLYSFYFSQQHTGNGLTMVTAMHKVYSLDTNLIFNFAAGF